MSDTDMQAFDALMDKWHAFTVTEELIDSLRELFKQQQENEKIKAWRLGFEDGIKKGIPIARARELLIRLAKSVAALYLGSSPLIRDETWRRINEMADQLLKEHGYSNE